MVDTYYANQDIVIRQESAIRTNRETKREVSHPAHVSKLKHSTVVSIVWPINDSSVKPDGKISNYFTFLVHEEWQ